MLIWLKKNLEHYKLKKKDRNFETIYKNGKNNHKIGNNEIQKQKLHQHKRPISIKRIYINKIVVPNDFKGFKYCIGYKDSKNIEHLPIFLPKMSVFWWIISKIQWNLGKT